MEKMKDLKSQNISLTLEVQTSVYFIKKGICELKKTNIGFEEDYISLTLLSTGFERLMKCIVCLINYKKNNVYPPFNEILNLSHDLDKSRKMIIEYFDNKKYKNTIAKQRDIEFVKNNNQILKFVSLLSDFGLGARYYNLDNVISNPKKGKNPRHTFDKLINEIIDNNDELKQIQSKISKGNFSESNDLDTKLIHELTILIERFARALSRLFTLGDLDKTMSGVVSCFFLMDNDLGKANYCKKID